MREPANLIFWKRIIKDNKIQDFIERGKKQQKLTIKSVLKYLKNTDPEFFKEVNGKRILKELKGK